MQHPNADRGFGRPIGYSPNFEPFRPSSYRSGYPQYDQHSSYRPHSQRQVRLTTNSYKLETDMNDRIYEYKLTVTPSEGYKNLPAKVLLRNYISRCVRKLIMEKIVPQLVRPNLLQGSVVIESKLEAIYSTIPLDTNIGSSSSTFIEPKKTCVIFENLLIEADLLYLLKVDIEIEYLGQSELGAFNDHLHKLCTSVLHHQLSISLMRYGSVYYKPQSIYSSTQDNRLDLISQHIMGISLSGLRRSVNNQTLVAINCPHSYVTSSYSLIDLLATFIIGYPVAGLQLNHSTRIDPSNLMPEILSTQGTEEWFKTFVSYLDGYKCRAGREDEHINFRFDLTTESAASLLINEKDSVTVQEHYRKLGINLNYPNLPCLKSRLDRHHYYPFEMCSLNSGQKVPIFRLSSAARKELALLNKPKPGLAYQLSCRARNEVANLCSKQFQSFGLSLSKNPVETNGSTLSKPTLQFRDRVFQPQRDYWESGVFHESKHLVRNWCVVNTVPVDAREEESFFHSFSNYCTKYGFDLDEPFFIYKAKDYLLEQNDGIETLIRECQKMAEGNLRLIMFIIDSSSTSLNRLVHLTFDEHPTVTASCLRVESIMNHRQHRSIYRTLVHKLNTRLGGTNVVYDNNTLAKLSLNCEDLMIIGLDVTHPDNELNGVSIVGCAYTYNSDLFRHRSLVWPQTARVEIITKMDLLMERILHEYYVENNRQLPKQIIIYRDGVSHEEFESVRLQEVSKAQKVIEDASRDINQAKPILSYIIAQKRHTMRFFKMTNDNSAQNPSGGTLIDQDVVSHQGREFYLYSNTSPMATARPLHYHVLLNGLGIDNIQKLTYFLCFNFGKCSGTLSMPSSLRYAHNAAYDARNRVIAAREFSENRFYTSKFFC